MKIAVFHNFLDNIGGAEIVALTFAKELNADLYTTNIDYEKIKKMGFENVKIFSIGKVPINAPFRQQIAFYKFRKLNLRNKYNYYIIAGDWAMSGCVNNKPNLWYIHSPLNELWEFRDYIRNNIVDRSKRPIYDLWVLYNRYLNKKYIKHAEKLVCNSENTKNRVKKYLKREDVVVINPPVKSTEYKNSKSKGYWLSVNRLFKNKRIDIQIEAFKKLKKEKLIIIGSYEKSNHFKKHFYHLIKNKPKNVEIKSWVDFEGLKKLYANCKGFITTAKDEDFGMTVVEAMASGKPVIAPDEGGYKESLIHNKTGILIKDINSNKLVEAIKEINKKLKISPNRYVKICQKQASKFDTKIFIKKIKEEIKR
ncbi:MAG TPA: glycosyltransferase [Candidatus Nanoarchaeia archaeon]|nr:glycosyltransferase [Candidatus Nanoarchaeia archaeon]